MRTPAQQAASSANGARSRSPKTGDGKRRSSMNARSLNLLAKITVVKNEPRQGFQELVRQHMLCIAPRNSVQQDAAEEICSAIEPKTIDLELATQSSPDDLECLTHACGALAGKNPRPKKILRRSLARIQALRQPGEKKFEQTTPVGHPSGGPPSGPTGGAQCAPKPLSMRLRTHIPVPRTSACEPQKPPPPPSHRNPRKTQEKPTETQEKPTEAHGNPRKTRRRSPLPLYSGSLRAPVRRARAPFSLRLLSWNFTPVFPGFTP